MAVWLMTVTSYSFVDLLIFKEAFLADISNFLFDFLFGLMVWNWYPATFGKTYPPLLRDCLQGH